MRQSRQVSGTVLLSQIQLVEFLQSLGERVVYIVFFHPPFPIPAQA
jgi:hypothetical protein